MATVTIKHATLTGAAANPAVLVDGPKWDATHTVTGLENVDNTSDANKPVSTAQAAADAAVAATGAAAVAAEAVLARNANNLTGGAVAAARMPALTGDITTSAGAVATTLATVNSNVGSFGSASATPVITVNAKGQVTAVTTAASTSVNGQTGAVVIPIVPFGRVTLTSGTATTEADVSAATTIYFTPSGMDYAGIYDGSNFAGVQFAELSLALDSNSGHTGYHQSGKNFFLGVFMNSGVITLASSVAWSSDTATGTGAGTCETEIYQGRMVNKVAMTVRFGSVSGNTVSVAARQFLIVGGFRASADGQATDSKSLRLVSNLYNAVPRKMFKTDATGTTYTYSTASFRQQRADATNQLGIFHCVGGRVAQASFQTFVSTSTATARFPSIGVGLDSTTTSATDGFWGLQPVTSAYGQPLVATYTGTPGIGYHTLVALEGGGGTDTQTWDPNSAYSGMSGWVQN